MSDGGASRTEQVVSNIAALGDWLDDEDLAALHAILSSD